MLKEDNIINELNDLVKLSRKSQIELENKSNKFVNNILKQISSKILEKKNNYTLSSLAVKETKFGNIKDKIKKNYNKTNNLLYDLNKVNLFEPIYNRKKNIYEIFKPIGIICGVTPSTNPIATSINYILNSLKARNSIIICPNPRSFTTVSKLIQIIKQILIKNKISENLVNTAPKEILRDDKIINLFNLCDKNIVTGNKQIISKVKKSIKPFLVFGTGNVPVVVDKTAKLDNTTESIVISKSFDNSTSCSADSVIVVDKKIYSKFVERFKKKKVYFLNDLEKKNLDKIYFKKGMINPSIIAKSANFILEKIGIKIQNKDHKLIAYEISNFNNDHYIFDEKILPLVCVIKSDNIDKSIEITCKVLEKNGKGHSAGIYSETITNIMKFSMLVPVSRIIVNQPHSQSAGGSSYNFLKSTLSLGCGSWGENLINDNLCLKDFCNSTKVVFKKKKNLSD